MSLAAVEAWLFSHYAATLLTELLRLTHIRDPTSRISVKISCSLSLFIFSYYYSTAFTIGPCIR